MGLVNDREGHSELEVLLRHSEKMREELARLIEESTELNKTSEAILRRRAQEESISPEPAG